MGMAKRGCAMVVLATALFGFTGFAWAHCDSLDGPVVQDARKALDAKDVTPVLKWVGEKHEKAVRAAFGKALAARGTGKAEAAEQKFFSELVRSHRAGEGAPFTGLKPAGSVEPAIAEADRALARGFPDALTKRLADAVAKGVRWRYDRAAIAYRNKDRSVADGRKFVAAYVEYTHYIEGVSALANGVGGHAAPHGAKAVVHGR